MAKIPVAGKSTTRILTKPVGGGVRKMNIPPAIKTEIRRIVQEEIPKSVKQGK